MIFKISFEIAGCSVVNHLGQTFSYLLLCIINVFLTMEEHLHHLMPLLNRPIAFLFHMQCKYITPALFHLGTSLVADDFPDEGDCHV